MILANLLARLRRKRPTPSAVTEPDDRGEWTHRFYPEPAAGLESLRGQPCKLLQTNGLTVLIRLRNGQTFVTRDDLLKRLTPNP